MSYIKVDIPSLDCRGIYLWIENYAGDIVTEYKATGEFKILIRMKLNNKSVKKVFKFPRDKTFKKAVEEVSSKRLHLKDEYKERGTLKQEKVIEEQKEPTFKKRFDVYINKISTRKNRPARRDSIKNFESTYRIWLSVWENKTVITIEDVRELINKMHKAGRSGNTIRNVLAPVKSIVKNINWSDLENDMPKLAEKRRFNWNIEDIKTLVKGMRNYKHTIDGKYINDRSKGAQMKAIFEFLLRGRRINEILTLKQSDIDLVKGIYIIRTENSKSREELTFQLDDELAKYITSDTEYLFDITPPTVRRHFASLLKELKLPSIHVHDIRHMVATLALENGANIADVSRMLGHSKVSTTEDRYVNKTTKMATRATNSFLDSVSEDK